MAYSTARVTAYCNTNFSATNTPASAAVLTAAAGSVVDIGDINCLPIVGKKSGTITIRDFAGVSSCDYMRITFSDSPVTSYWIVTGYEYVSGDTVSVSLLLDGFLSCGGVDGITALSGYVNRHTVSDDTYGKYNQSDDMLIPSQNLIFRSVEKYGGPSENEKYRTIVLSSINLAALGTLSAASMALTYGDVTSGQAVVVPSLPPLPTWEDNGETVTLGTVINYGDKSYKLPGVQCFDYDGTTSNGVYCIREGISRARSLGVEGAIIAMYALPESKFTISTPNIPILSSDAPVIQTTNAYITAISSRADIVHTTGIKFDFKTVNNKRAIYGDLKTVKIVSMSSGEEAEYSIEDLYSTTDKNEFVKVAEVADGRAHGRPTYYPEYYMQAKQAVDNMLSSVSGMEWQNVPLVFDYASGYGLTKIKHYATTQIEAKTMLENQGLDWFKQGFGMLGSMVGDYNGFSPIGNAININNTIYSNELAGEQFARARAFEEKQMYINTRIQAPEINFPVSESVRDFVGNGVIVAFVTPTDDDINRFDKILTMYGYKDAGSVLSVADLTAGKYFSYIEASGVQVQTSAPVDRTIREAAEDQISAGIRVWKQRPDFALYAQANR